MEVSRTRRAEVRIGSRFENEKVETMSVAFTREESAETAAEVELPDRPVSPHLNLVTASGLEALANAMAEWRAAYNAAQQIEDAGERRRAVAVASREMRYFADRLRTAQIVPPPAEFGAVAFGHQVTFTRDDGRRQAFRIVGEDEADPRNGSISYVSPVARALIGRVRPRGGGPSKVERRLPIRRSSRRPRVRTDIPQPSSAKPRSVIAQVEILPGAGAGRR